MWVPKISISRCSLDGARPGGLHFILRAMPNRRSPLTEPCLYKVNPRKKWPPEVTWGEMAAGSDGDRRKRVVGRWRAHPGNPRAAWAGIKKRVPAY